MSKKKNREGIKQEFSKLAIEITLELVSMGMTETEIIAFWKECVDKVKNNNAKPEHSIEIKAQLLDTHDNFDSWLKTVSGYQARFGFNNKVVHLNKNGYNVTGYELKNYKDLFPVKSYLLTRETPEPTPFKSISNN